MSAESKARLDAAISATHDSIQTILQGWQKHMDATKLLHDAKQAAEAEVVTLHTELSDWHEKVNELLKPIVDQVNGGDPSA